MMEETEFDVMPKYAKGDPVYVMYKGEKVKGKIAPEEPERKGTVLVGTSPRELKPVKVADDAYELCNFYDVINEDDISIGRYKEDEIYKTLNDIEKANKK